MNTVSPMLSGNTGLRAQAPLVVVGDALNFAAAFVASMVLARLLSVEEMGAYRQITYLLSLIVALLEMGLAATAYRFWAILDDSTRAAYVKMVGAILVGMGLLGGIVVLALVTPISHWYNNPALERLLVIVCLFPLSAIPVMLLRPVLISRGYPLRATLLELAFLLLQVSALVIPLLLGSSLERALVIWIVVCTLRLLFVPIVLRQYLFDRGHWWNGEVLAAVWAYLWPIQLGRLFGNVTTYLDKIVASLLLTTTGFAIYSMGAREIPFIGTVAFSVSNVLVPHLVGDVEAGNVSQVARRWRLACERSALLTYLVAAFCIWYAVPVMQFLFSASYAESSNPFRVFAAMTFVRVIEYASLAKAFGRPDLILKSAIIGALTIALAMAPLAKLFGPAGIASAFLVSTISQSVYLLLHYRGLLKMPIASFYPWGRLIQVLLIAFACVAVSDLTLSRFLHLSADTRMVTLAWKLAVAFAASAALYAGATVVAGFVRIPNRNIMRERVRRSITRIW
jgi:O-antigen/teichoic acid export membrane protein